MNNLTNKTNYILTFGYGNRNSLDLFLKYLKDFDVAYVIDVRIKSCAWSRKWYGYEIEKLCESLSIKYLSYTALGNISGTEKWISPTPEKVQNILKNIIEQTTNSTLLLLCAEMNHQKCHRTEVANELQKLTLLPIKHLD